jgi:hypothetical protein
VIVGARDLFLRPGRFFVSPHATVVVPVLNGTFSTTENAVSRDRLADLSLVGPAGRQAIDGDAWTEKDPGSTVGVTVAGPGTYVVGAAIKPKMLSLPGPEFNAYLKDEGIDHVLAARKAQGRLQEASHERYSKFPKTLMQVGDLPSNDFATELGYEAEILPIENPYTLKAGSTLHVRCLVLGQPIANYVVQAGGRKGKTENRLVEQRVVTNGDGVAALKLTASGEWYVKFVHMREVTGAEANYESRWATLTFEIR